MNEVTHPTYELAEQHCETYGRITYCANPGYESFIDYWRDVTEEVLDQLPASLADRSGTVRQVLDRRQIEGETSAEFGEVIADPGLDWGRGSGRGVAELILGLDVAAWALEIETFEIPAGCAPDEQARSIVQMWLAGQVGPAARDIASDLGPFADAITGSEFGVAEHGGPRAGRYARQLLARPDDDVGAVARANWDRLVDPSTSDDDAERILNLDHVEVSVHERGERLDAAASGDPARACD